MSGSIKMFCGCNEGKAAAFQNQIYGDNQRIHTIGGTAPNYTYTCSVCGKSKSDGDKKKKSK